MNLTLLRRLLAMGLLFVMALLTLPVLAGAQQPSNATSGPTLRARITRVAVMQRRRIRRIRRNIRMHRRQIRMQRRHIRRIRRRGY